MKGPAPTLTAVSPTSGITQGGLVVTLMGTNFAAGATVTFASVAATSVTVVSGSTITCVTPAGTAGTVSVTVTNVDAQAALLGSAYTYVGVPTLTSLTPTAGSNAGGTTLTLTGTNFSAGATVTVGGAAATSVVVVSTTSITCATPAGAVGPANVTVTNPSASGNATLANGFTFQGAAPTLTSVAPTVGPAAGGTVLTLTGTNFYAGATVTVGGTNAGVVSVASTQIVATTPAGTPGAVAVVVTNADAQFASLASAFTYQSAPPTVSAISPLSGPQVGGTAVTLTGTNFLNGATVTIGGNAATSVVVVSATSITCATPAGTQGQKNVTVTNPDLTSGTLTNGFTYLGPAPTVSNINPNSGPRNVNTTVTITGTGFQGGATVTFGGVSGLSTAVISSTEVRSNTPTSGSTGAVDVVVTNPDTQSVTVVGGYTYTAWVDLLPPTFGGLTSATARSPRTVDLAWTTATDNVDPSSAIRYAIYGATSSGGQNYSAPPWFLTDPGVTIFTVGGLTQNVTYYFVVRARDTTGNQTTNTQQQNALTFSTSAPHLRSAPSNLGGARADHTATLLTDGRVLVAGGNNAGALATCEVYDPFTGTWTATPGGLGLARRRHTATLLQDGRVLAAGGDSAGAVASCELFNPVAGTWTFTGLLNGARERTVSLLLGDGRVLVVGGDNSGALATCEIFDPTTGSWTSTGSLATARRRHAAIILPDGRVLAVAGENSSTTAACELFDPSAGTWSATGALTVARRDLTATVLRTGKVLATAGDNSGGSTPAPALYDPMTGAWSNIATTATQSQHTATLLPNGAVLLAFGYATSTLTGCYMFDPLAGTWTGGGSSQVSGRRYHTATLLRDGDVLLVGGEDTGPVATCEVFDLTAGANSGTSVWQGSGATSPIASMITSRQNPATVPLTDGRILAVSGRTTACEIYNPTAGTWSATGGAATARSGHHAMLMLDGRVLMFSGSDLSANPISTAELYDPTTGTWSATGSPSGARPSCTAVILPDGRVLAAGGYSGVTLLASSELYDASTGTWTSTGSLGTARSGARSTLLRDGRVLAVSGRNGSGALASCEIYDPSTGTWSATASLSFANDVAGLYALPVNQVLSAGSGTLTERYDPTTGTWTQQSFSASLGNYPSGGLLPSGRVLVDTYVYRHTSRSLTSAAAQPNRAVLLADGRLLSCGVAGSLSTTANVFDEGIGFADPWRPVISAVAGSTSFPVTLSYSTAITITGLRFRGAADSSGGTAGSAASGIPFVTLEGPLQGRGQDLGGSILWYPLAPSGFASGTSLVITTPASGSLPKGHYWFRVSVDGIPSVARMVYVP